MMARRDVMERMRQRIEAGNDSSEAPLQIRRANLTEALSEGGTASFEFWKYNGSSFANLGLSHSYEVHDTLSLGPLSSGTKCWIVRLGDYRRWELLGPDTGSDEGPTPVRFRLTAALTTGGSAAAVIRTWNGSMYVDGSAITVNDFAACAADSSDATGLAIELDDRVGIYEILEIAPESGTSIIKFELTTGLTLGGSAAALVLEWDGDSYETVAGAITVFDFTDTPGSWAGDSGYQGWAILTQDRAEYEIIWMETKAERIEAVLTENMGATTVNEAAATVSQYFRGKNPGSPITVYDDQQRFADARSGAKCTATYDPATDEYKVTTCQVIAERVEFTLTEDMGATTAGRAAATINEYYRGQDPGTPLDMYDTQSLYADAVSGAKGKATWDNENSRYSITSIQLPVVSTTGFIRFTLTGTLSTTTESQTVNVEKFWGIADPGLTVTAYNIDDDSAGAGNYLLAGASGDTGLATYNDDLERWEMLLLECT